MANVSGPYGLRPSRHQTGGCNRNSTYTIASAYNTNIFYGDPVKLAGTLNNRAVELAAAGDIACGVFAGCSYVDAQGTPRWSKYWPADTVATDVVAYVYDDPDMLFTIEASTAITAASIGQYADWDDTAGSAATGISGQSLDTPAATFTGVKLMGVVPSPDNELGQYAKVEVMFAEHEYKRTS